MCYKTINTLNLRKRYAQKISGCGFDEKKIFQTNYLRKYAYFFFVMFGNETSNYLFQSI